MHEVLLASVMALAVGAGRRGEMLANVLAGSGAFDLQPLQPPLEPPHLLAQRSAPRFQRLHLLAQLLQRAGRDAGRRCFRRTAPEVFSPLAAQLPGNAAEIPQHARPMASAGFGSGPPTMRRKCGISSCRARPGTVRAGSQEAGGLNRHRCLPLLPQ